MQTYQVLLCSLITHRILHGEENNLYEKLFFLGCFSYRTDLRKNTTRIEPSDGLRLTNCLYTRRIFLAFKIKFGFW